MRRALLALFLVACQPKEAPPPEPAPAEPEVAQPAVEATPAPEPLVPVKAFAVSATGERIEVDGEVPVEGIPADATFEITSEHALTEIRIRLFNGNDKLVPSDDKASVGQGFRYELKPREALESGAFYRIVVDEGATGHPKDVTGQVYQGRSFRFVVGHPPATESD